MPFSSHSIHKTKEVHKAQRGHFPRCNVDMCCQVFEFYNLNNLRRGFVDLLLDTSGTSVRIKDDPCPFCKCSLR